MLVHCFKIITADLNLRDFRILHGYFLLLHDLFFKTSGQITKATSSEALLDGILQVRSLFINHVLKWS